MRSSRHCKTISQILILAMLHLCWLTSYGYAEMIPTESAAQVQDDRQRLLDLLSRQEVVDELKKYGISKVEATARINSLTDEEVIQIAGRLDELPPGGDIGTAFAAALYLAAMIIYYSPVIFSGAVYIAFTPIAAGVCIFKEDSWNDCMGNYWGHFVKGVKGIYGSSDARIKNECTKKCGDQRTKCYESSEYIKVLSGDEEYSEIRHQCNLDHSDCFKICQIKEEKEKVKEVLSEKVEEDCDPGMESCP